MQDGLTQQWEDASIKNLNLEIKKLGKKELTKQRREKDLIGHIEGSDLSSLSKDSNMLKSIHSWPQKMQNDYQLVTAFTYIKGWTQFSISENIRNNLRKK